jgi:hypothetical protein
MKKLSFWQNGNAELSKNLAALLLTIYSETSLNQTLNKPEPCLNHTRKS